MIEVHFTFTSVYSQESWEETRQIEVAEYEDTDFVILEFIHDYCSDGDTFCTNWEII